MEYGIITFRSHPCDKSLDMEFYQLMTPILNKTDKYVVAMESPLTPEAHYHIFLTFKGDVTHLKQKFKTKSFTNWIEKTKSTMTVISTKFDDHALQIKKVAKTEEDRLKTLGYVCKENVIKTKGFDDKQITEAVKYYHTCERKVPKIESKDKVVNVKTILPYMRHVADKYEMQPYDREIPYYMAKEGIYCDVTGKQMNKLRAYLEANIKEQDEFSKNVLVSELLEEEYNDCNCPGNLYDCHREIKALYKFIKCYKEDFHNHDIDGFRD